MTATGRRFSGFKRTTKDNKVYLTLDTTKDARTDPYHNPARAFLALTALIPRVQIKSSLSLNDGDSYVDWHYFAYHPYPYPPRRI
jgi:hypothetical protein